MKTTSTKKRFFILDKTCNTGKNYIAEDLSNVENEENAIEFSSKELAENFISDNELNKTQNWAVVVDRSIEVFYSILGCNEKFICDDKMGCGDPYSSTRFATFEDAETFINDNELPNALPIEFIND